MGLMQSIRDAVGRGIVLPAAPAGPPTSLGLMGLRLRSEYMRGNRGLVFSGWRPALREAHDEVSANWEVAAARALDIIHNSGWIAGAIDQAVADTVGTGLRLNAMPDPAALGFADTTDGKREAAKWARDVERRFALWAKVPMECDIEGRRTFGQMQAASFRQWFATGEMLSEFLYRPRPSRAFGTKMRIVPPYRLSSRSDLAARMIQGIRMDGDGLPISYVFKAGNTNSLSATLLPVEIERGARDEAGRPVIVHSFDGPAGTVRGITPLIHALAAARQFGQLADATLMAAIIQTVFAATVSSETPTEEILSGLLTEQEQARLLSEGGSRYDAWFDAQAAWYGSTNLDVGVNGRIAHLFPGQKMEFHGARHPGANYPDFSKHLLRELARCIGVTYEGATGDYAGVTFSSIRMATNAIWEIVKARRAFLVAPHCQAAYEAWLEEDIEAGRTPFPGGIEAFLTNRTGAARAEWVGSPKPQPDDLKTANAHKTWKSIGVVSDGMIATDLGQDIEDIYAERAREKQLRAELGLTDPVADPVEMAAALAKTQPEPDPPAEQ